MSKIFDVQELSSSFFFCLQVVNRSICLSQFPTAIPNNYFPSEFAEMLASHLFLFHPTTAPNQKKHKFHVKGGLRRLFEGFFNMSYPMRRTK